MWTVGASFPEACAFVTGVDAALRGQLLIGFQPWLVERTGSDRPELAFPSLVFRHAFSDRSLELSTLTPDDNARASALLFALLDEYFEGVEETCG